MTEDMISQEILRLRERMHALRKELMSLAYRIESLEKLKPSIDEVVLAQKVAHGVKEAIKEDDTIGFTRWQKVGIGAGVLSGIGAFAIAVIQSLHL